MASRGISSTGQAVNLGEMVNAVIRQLEFENLSFDVVMTGSMFEGGEMLIRPYARDHSKTGAQSPPCSSQRSACAGRSNAWAWKPAGMQ